jgi:hypothetical protein
MTFADAVKDAEEAGPDEVSTGLIAILPSTPGLLWSDADQKRRVLMVTWTSFKGYDDQKGKTLPLGRETWVTAAPFVADFCKGKGANPGALSARLEQLLGLPANNGKDRFECGEDRTEISGRQTLPLKPLAHHAARGQPRCSEREELAGEEDSLPGDPWI